MNGSKWPEVLGVGMASLSLAVMARGWPWSTGSFFDSGSSAAAWVQAVGSVLAIVAAIGIARHQTMAERARRAAAKRESSKTVAAILDAATEEIDGLGSLAHDITPLRAAPSSAANVVIQIDWLPEISRAVDRLADIREELVHVPAALLPTTGAALALLAAKRAVKEAIDCGRGMAESGLAASVGSYAAAYERFSSITRESSIELKKLANDGD